MNGEIDGDVEKLRRLLEHWIEHSQEHTVKYKEWAEKIREKKKEVSDLLNQAVEKFEEGEHMLKKARDILE